MATIAIPVHRHHGFWLRIVEDLACVLGVALVGWILFTTVGLHQTTLRSVLLPPGLLGPAVRPLPEPMSVVAASRPMLAAVAAAAGLEERGLFGAETAAAWRRARAECRRFAVQPIATGGAKPVMLWLYEAERDRAEELSAQIAVGDAPPDMLEALTTLRAEAVRNAERIRGLREIANFDYWRAVCEDFESGLEAREAAWRAGRAAAAGRLEDAQDAHEASFQAWRRLLDAQPVLLDDRITVEELGEQVDRYRGVLAARGAAFPAAFVLQDVVDRLGVPGI